VLNQYRQLLNLQNAAFERIDHADAIVAIVYKISKPNEEPLILKICPEAHHYWREVFFLQHFSGQIPVPRIVETVKPEGELFGAILMEYLPGSLLTKVDFTDSIAYELGETLAKIHLNPTKGYGDLIFPEKLSLDPRAHFTLKLEEGLDESKDHLPGSLIDKCRLYYYKHLELFNSVDGPCMIHRDFRAGNVIIQQGKVRGIIDWASARASFAEEDFCPMEHGEYPLPPSRKSAFLSGYSSIRPRPNTKAIMPFLRFNRAVATIGYTVKTGSWDNRCRLLYQLNRNYLEKLIYEE
jgi:Predicted aminoglycoside phosphotransferase